MVGHNIKKTSMLIKVWSEFWGGCRERTLALGLQSPILLTDLGQFREMLTDHIPWGRSASTGIWVLGLVLGVEGWLESPEGGFLLLSWEQCQFIHI